MRTKSIVLITLASFFTWSSFAQSTDHKTVKNETVSALKNKDTKETKSNKSKETAKAAATKKSPTTVKEVVPKTVDLDRETTYERIIDKGFESPDLLKKVADKRFFNNDFVLAARWYGCLFDLTTDLEPVYYYRYSVCLKETNQEEKAKHMMELFKKSSAKE